MKNIIFCFLFAGCAAVIPSEPTARIEFTAPDTYPEGVVFDSIANVFYVSSARTGAIGKVTPEGVYSPLITDSGFKSSYGLRISPDGRKLYACIGDANYSKFTSKDTRKKMARLVIINIANGKKTDDIDLSGLVAKEHFLNDITFDDNQNAYVTDSFSNVIYKVAKDGKASVFADSPLFETKGIGLNGIAFNKGGYLLASSSGTGMLYKIDIKNPKNVTKVVADQFFVNGDGILFINNKTLVLVQNGGSDKVYELTSDDDWSSARLSGTTLVADRFSYPSTATKVKDKIWVMNAKFNEIVDSNSVSSQKFAIQYARFMPIPKRKP